jgi:alanine dehydrogenase
VRGAAEHDPALLAGVNTVAGKITNAAVAEALEREFVEPMSCLPS